MKLIILLFLFLPVFAQVPDPAHMQRILVQGGPALDAPPAIDERAERILRFNKNWNIFSRKYFGCPLTGYLDPTTPCKMVKQWDDAALQAAIKDADWLFKDTRKAKKKHVHVVPWN